MTISSLVSALAIGTVLGLSCRWIVPVGRAVPFWVPLAVAVGSAMLGTVVGRLAGIDTSGLSPVEVILQVIFAASGISLVAATADRKPRDSRYNSIDRSR